MFFVGILELLILLLVIVLPACLLVALTLLMVKNRRRTAAYVPPPVPSRIEHTTQIKNRDNYQAERERLTAMVGDSKISADEAGRLLEVLERETTTTTCPFCGEEIRSEAVKCKVCRQFLLEEMHRPRRLTKSNDKMLSGVCAGLADYAGIDASLVRIITALVILFSGVLTGLIVYLVAALILPSTELYNA